MSEIPSPYPESPSETPDWLEELRREQTLEPTQARQWLIATFFERIANYKQNHIEMDPWVVPFYYRVNDNRGDGHFVGAIWLPEDHVQDFVNDVGYFVHHALVIDMEQAVQAVGIELSSFFLARRLGLDGDVPTTSTGGFFALELPYVKTQVLNDFGVRLVN